jgi:hypothetical protein
MVSRTYYILIRIPEIFLQNKGYIIEPRGRLEYKSLIAAFLQAFIDPSTESS